MSRRSRIVIPGLPHHVTQRGGRRQIVFFEDSDRVFYLHLLKENGERYGVQFLDYCLMTNHVHHLAVPLEHDSLRWTFQMTHKRYADFVNGRCGWTGHLWQQRFYSSPVDAEYLWVTVRYILRNPVRAGLAKHPMDYRWSSAKSHQGLISDPVLTEQPKWVNLRTQRTNWYEWLGEPEDPAKVSNLRKRTHQDLPTGSDEFLDQLERQYGVNVRPAKIGRPKKGG